MSSKIKISVLCHDLSHNCLGRAYILAAVLQRYYEVEIVGPAKDGKIWAPLRGDQSIKYKILTSKNWYKNSRLIDGDIIYASKIKGASLGYALIKKITSRKPLILDIDDWDFGFFLDAPLLNKIYDATRFWNSNNSIYTWLLEKFVGRADTITVSNSFLKKRFGGTLIPHFRDTNQFQPKKFNQLKVKKELGLEGQKIVLFLGTPHRHKGILDLITAVERLQRKDVTLLIIGASQRDKKRLPRKMFLKVRGPQPFDEIPRFLALADLVVLFQANSKAAQGQLPAKIFDAMSMAKPIIASSVSDLPGVLEGCGEIVEPGDVDNLTKKMSELLNNPKYALELGERARQKCIEEYSYDAIAPKLHAVVGEVLAKVRETAKA